MTSDLTCQLDSEVKSPENLTVQVKTGLLTTLILRLYMITVTFLTTSLIDPEAKSKERSLLMILLCLRAKRTLTTLLINKIHVQHAINYILITINYAIF